MTESKRLLGTAGQKGCKFGCIYCFTQDPTFTRCPTLDTDRPRDLVARSHPVDVVQPACDTELFLAPNWRDYLDNLTSTGRIISFASKATVSDDDITFLKRINEMLQSRNAVLHICITIVRLRLWEELEPRAPSPDERIRFLRQLWEAGIGTCVAVRPMVPFVGTDELSELVSRTYRFSYGYLSGPLYLTRRMRQLMDAKGIDYKSAVRQATWQTDQPELQAIESPQLEEELAALVRARGREFFKNNTDAALYVRDQSRALGGNLSPSWGPEMRREAVATVYVVDPSTREFLLMFHRDLGAWLAPGGHVELGENAIQTAMREAEEEVGLVPEVRRIRGEIPSAGLHYRSVPTPSDSPAFCTLEEFISPLGGQDPHIHVDSVILATASSRSAAQKKDAGEVASHDWFTIEQIEGRIPTFDNVPVICRAILSALETRR